jgi:hypothetical protein
LKVTVFLIAGLAAILVLSMPLTLETFGGSHGYETRECEGCHMDEVNFGMVMSDLTCVSCHNNEHHASSPQCITCHPIADTLYDTAESHRNVMNQAQDSGVMEGENEACFMCHSSREVQFSFNRPQYIEFDMVRESDNWIILNLTTGPAASWITSNQRHEGSHQWIAQGQCSTCHSDIKENLSSHYYPSFSHTSGTECGVCHQRSASQHVATSISCFETCHTDHEGNLITQIMEQLPEYQSNICIGCHNENTDNEDAPSNTHFKVYLEPIYRVERVE